MKIMSAKCSNTNRGMKNEKYLVPGVFTRYHTPFHLGTIKAEKGAYTGSYHMGDIKLVSCDT